MSLIKIFNFYVKNECEVNNLTTSKGREERSKMEEILINK